MFSLGIFELVILLIVAMPLLVIPAGLNAYLADGRRQPVWLWVLLGLFLSWLSTLLLLVFFRKKS
jgi:hypothetical protein